jgi:hypothetical protein
MFEIVLRLVKPLLPTTFNQFDTGYAAEMSWLVGIAQELIDGKTSAEMATKKLAEGYLPKLDMERQK